ncbi:MAG TPA: hypothetical protein VHE57_06610 [Mycobacteriales bacterium]|nr:hypothetical protein [Mycobacteriales bacterium]
MIISRRTRPPALLTAATLGACLVLGGCSGSSSGGSPAPTAAAARTQTFHDVTPRANQILQRTLALMRGVASDTYQDGELVVTFRPTAEKVDQTNVANVVRQAKQKAAKKDAKHGEQMSTK